MSATTHALQYAPWTSDVELAFYSALASLKINHDKLDSSSRKVLGLYEINPKDAPERSSRMQIHGTALTTDESAQGYYRGEGTIRNYNTIEEFRKVDKAAHIERAGRTVWDSILDGTIYSCPSLLSSFSAICYADLKKYKFTYHFAYPAVHSDPVWKLIAEGDDPASGIKRLKERETEALVDSFQTWRYSVDTRQHGFFLAKRLRKNVLDAEWRMGTGEIEQEEDDGNLHRPRSQKSTQSSILSEMGFLWSIGSLASHENGFFDNADEEDCFVCFADPSTYASNPGWMLRNLLILVRQRWHLDKVQILCYRDTHQRRDQQNSLIMRLQAAEPVFPNQTAKQPSRHVPTMSASSALRPTDVDAFGELVERKQEVPEPIPERPKTPPKLPPPPLPKITGWERNEQNKIVSRTVDLASYLDPSRLADQAVDLNLKLIKWRISPSIDLDTIKHTSCLLLGAGTLGSYVARNLMGWGVRKISFVDNARVSYSNPVRQPLFEFRDCLEGGARKAERAAEALKEIYPGADATGYYMSVPMAGHPIMEEERVKKEFEKLRGLIESHDAVFLLMDTRESRWLPTVMAKAAGKIVINAALGFDTYMVMRHGLRPTTTARPAEERKVVEHPDDERSPIRIAASDPVETNGDVRNPPLVSSTASEGEELGCYFCSDVVAPADSLKSATLDQQCTVTRPGAAPIASALAVELLVSLTQHRLRGRAPAPNPITTGGSANQIQSAPPTDPTLPNSHPLGTVPHQLRGYMSTWQTIQVKGRAYDCCAACSPSILAAYEKEGWEFVKRAVNENGFVEEVSGLAEVQRKAEEAERAMEMEEEDEWGEDEGEGEMV